MRLFVCWVRRALVLVAAREEVTVVAVPCTAVKGTQRGVPRTTCLRSSTPVFGTARIGVQPICNQ
jgi:hypothetical protein